jgi:hypothetical protein
MVKKAAFPAPPAGGPTFHMRCKLGRDSTIRRLKLSVQDLPFTEVALIGTLPGAPWN